MPLSISNSKQRCPGGPWGRIWISSLLLTAVLLGSAEFFFRSRGFYPTVTDDKALWALHRSRIDWPGGKTPFVISGASRIQLGFNPDVFTDRCPDYSLINLSVDGHSAAAVLRDLAEDENFKGILLYSFDCYSMRKEVWDGQLDYVDYYHQEMTLSILIERIMSAYLQSHLVLLYPTLRPDLVIKNGIETKSLPRPFYVRTRFNRFRNGDYTKIYVENFKKRGVERMRRRFIVQPVSPPDQWLNDLEEVETWIRRIQQRGGTVILIRMPSSGEGLQIEEEAYPRAVYWDSFAKLTSAVTIHFLDYPKLSQFECPDASHLDFRDAPKFTAALLDILEEKGILSNSEKTYANP